MTEVLVQMSHVRKAKLCSRGARAWFRHHGLDWTDFLKNGIPASTLLATGDEFALKVVGVARGR